jgi:hypothetical protein
MLCPLGDSSLEGTEHPGFHSPEANYSLCLSFIFCDMGPPWGCCEAWVRLGFRACLQAMQKTGLSVPTVDQRWGQRLEHKDPSPCNLDCADRECVCMSVHVWVRESACVWECMCVSVRVWVCMCVQVWVNTFVHTAGGVLLLSCRPVRKRVKQNECGGIQLLRVLGLSALLHLPTHCLWVTFRSKSIKKF